MDMTTSHCTNSSPETLLDSISNNDPRLSQLDECGLTPLQIVCSNPHDTSTIIREMYNKYPEAATMVNAKDMKPWHMYLVMKSMIVGENFVQFQTETISIHSLTRMVMTRMVMTRMVMTRMLK